MRNLCVLTERELEVLILMAAGYRRKAIAARLSITESTVKSHIRSIFGKLGADTRSHAINIAQRCNLLRLEQIPEKCN